MLARQPGLAEQVHATCEDSLDGLFALEDPATVTVGSDGLEVWVAATLYDAPVRGRIDRLYDASGAYVVADYKTGKVPKPAYTQKAFFGLWTYAAALAASDPDRLLPDRIEDTCLRPRAYVHRLERGVCILDVEAQVDSR